MRKYLEGKVFDNKKRDVKYVIQGFGQLLQYLRQYHAPNGYLLVYKTCEEQPVIDGADQVGQIPVLGSEGKAIFFLVVDLCQYKEPVSQRKYKAVSVTADQLCKADRHDLANSTAAAPEASEPVAKVDQ